MKPAIMALLLMSSVCAAGCSGSQSSLGPGTHQQNSDGTFAARYASIPPGECRIVGTVVSVDSALDTVVPGSPCSVEPCNAVIRVDSVIRYGSAFPPLSTGSSINLHFFFTLAHTTKRLFPNLKTHFPGLQAGSTFIGNIEVILQPNKNGRSRAYAIYGYEKQ